jgi:hypothetical protein
MKSAPFLLAVAACQSAPALSDAQAACHVTISFGSYAMGIDREAAAAIEAMLAGSADAEEVTRTGGGREGEFALCVQSRDKAAALRLVERIRPLLPAKPRGPISVQGPNGRIDAPAL